MRNGSSKSIDRGRRPAVARSARIVAIFCGLLSSGTVPDAARGQTAAGSDPGSVSRYCLDPSAGLSIDHVVIVVSHLPTAEADFRELGFFLKAGRRHENGLRNAHIKFRDGSALELMTIEGRSGDRVAAEYEEFLANGEGAAFLAIEADLGAVTAAAQALDLAWETSSAGPYSWVTLADSTPVFFIEWSRRPIDPDSLLAQVDDVSGISSVRLAATEQFGRLLSGLGAVRCPEDSTPDSPAAITGRPVPTIQLLDRSEARFEIRRVTLTGGRCTGARGLDPTRTHGVEIVIIPPLSCLQ